jgi:hypothetical protein
VIRELRSPWEVLLLLAHLVTAWLAYAALVTQPQGTWDESTLTGIEAACAMVVAAGAATLLLSVLPLRRKALGPWWLAPPVVFLTLGAARWVYIAQNYPQGAGG